MSSYKSSIIERRTASPEARKTLSRTGSVSPGIDSSEHVNEEIKSANTIIETDGIEEVDDVSFYHHDGEVEESDIEKSLIKRGFFPLNKIIVDDGDGNQSVQYVHAETSEGFPLYVSTKDSNGSMEVKEGDKFVYQTTQAKTIPYSVVMGQSTCARSSGCRGSVVNCSNGICVIENSTHDAPNPSVTYFVETTEGDLMSGVNVGSNMTSAHPIISYSSIITDPEGSKARVKDASQILFSNSYESTMKDIDKLKENVDNLHDMTHHFDELVDSLYGEIQQSLDTLNNVKESYDLCDLDHEDSEKLTLINYNIRKRIDFLNKLSQLGFHMPEINSELEFQMKKIKSMLELVIEKLECVDEILEMES